MTRKGKKQGWGGLLVMLVILAAGAFRYLGLDRVDDPALVELVRGDLVGQVLNRRIDQLGNARGADAERYLSTGIEIHGITASSPLLSFGSGEDFILKVDYAVRDSGGVSREQQQLYRARHPRQTGRWQLLSGEPSLLAYYLNFI